MGQLEHFDADHDPDAPRAELRVVPFEDVQERSIDWLFPGYVPLGMMTVVAGRPGCGKSTLTTDWASRVSRGVGWPPGNGECEQGTTLIFTAEDPFDCVVKPRLRAAEADCRYVLGVEGVGDQLSPDVDPVQLDKHRGLFERAIERHRPRLVIVDPLSGYLGDTNPNANGEIRRILTPLARLADEHEFALVVVEHLNKRRDMTAMERISGSVGLPGLARMVFLVEHGETDQDPKEVHCVKSNIAPKPPGLAFRLDNNAVAWLAERPNGDADQAVNRVRDLNAEQAEIRDFLLERLAGGEVPQKQMLAEAQELGFAEHTTQRVARKLKIERPRMGAGPGSFVVWRLPEGL